MNITLPHSKLRLVARTGVCVAVLAIVSACQNTIASRAQEMSATFASATPEQQQTMKEGWLNYGFTPNMVYIALGKPDEIKTTEHKEKIWVYRNYEATAPSGVLGKPKIGVVYANPKLPSTTGISFTVSQDVANTPPAEEIPTLLVYFYNDKASRIVMKRSSFM
ncbi:MAG: hypothetical protein JWM32_2597 [Verrucomicrobia bacterium]|nr:hypothetical protein [Verrucomicrobiota bacterium]